MKISKIERQNMETEIVITEDEKLKQLALSDLARARGLAVVDNESYRDCCMLELQIKAAMKEVNDKLSPIVESARRTWKAALQLRDDIIEPRNQALGIVQGLRVGYERRREEKRRQLEQEKQNEAAEKAKQESEQLAVILDKADEPELAKQVRENVQIPVVSLESDIPKVKGVGTRTVWYFKVVDENKIARSYMTPHEKKIQGLVNSQGKDAEKIIGGIEVWSEEVPRGAAKK